MQLFYIVLHILHYCSNDCSSVDAMSHSHDLMISLPDRCNQGLKSYLLFSIGTVWYNKHTDELIYGSNEKKGLNPEHIYCALQVFSRNHFIQCTRLWQDQITSTPLPVYFCHCNTDFGTVSKTVSKAQVQVYLVSQDKISSTIHIKTMHMETEDLILHAFSI